MTRSPDGESADYELPQPVRFGRITQLAAASMGSSTQCEPSNQLVLVRERRGRRARGDSDLGEDVADMTVDGLLAQ